MSIQSFPTLSPSQTTREISGAGLQNTSDFRDALLAAVAMLAYADGEMAGVERRRIMTLARENPVLADVPRSEIADELAVHEANYRLDPEVAQILAREKLVRIAGQRRLAQMIVNACRAVLPADGVAHPSEYRVLAEIRGLVGLERPDLQAPIGAKAAI